MVLGVRIGRADPVGGVSRVERVEDEPCDRCEPCGCGGAPVVRGHVEQLAHEIGARTAVVVGGAPLAFTILRRALGSSHKNLSLLLVPMLALLALLIYAAFMALVAFNRLSIPGVLPSVSPGAFPLGNRLLVGGFMLVFVLGAIASAAAVWRAASNTDEELRVPGRAAAIKPYEFALQPAVIATGGMVWMLLATILWGWLSYTAMPNLLSENWGLLLMNTGLSFGATLVIMTGSSLVAIFGVARAYASRRLAS